MTGAENDLGVMMRMGKLLVVAIAIQVVLEASLLATWKEGAKFTCPVCKNEFSDYSLVSWNSFGGSDRDFMERARGEQPILFFPKTCPVCYYSGYRDDFDTGAKIPDATRELIQQIGVLEPGIAITRGTSAFEIPAWVKYDLIAQTYRLRDMGDKEVAFQFLKASWAVRLDTALPKDILGYELVRKTNEWIQKRRKPVLGVKPDEITLAELKEGRDCVRRAKSLHGESRLIVGLAALSAFRSHGEHAEAEAVLPILKPVIPADRFTEFERYLKKSIQRERNFQIRALMLLEEAVETEQDNEKKASLTYLCGELYRRLGRWDKARQYFKQVLQIEGHPDWLGKWAREQMGLIPD